MTEYVFRIHDRRGCGEHRTEREEFRRSYGRLSMDVARKPASTEASEADAASTVTAEAASGCSMPAT